MTLQSSGAISLANIQTEFGGSNPIGINEYYGSGGAPASGTISIGNFYGRSYSFFTTNMFGYVDNRHCAEPGYFIYNGPTIYSPPSQQVYIMMFAGFSHTLKLYLNGVLVQTWSSVTSNSFTAFTSTIFSGGGYNFQAELPRGGVLNSGIYVHLNNSAGVRILDATTYDYCYDI